MKKVIDLEEGYNNLLDGLIPDLNLVELDRNEAECIALAWLLKTKLYLMGEGSRKWSEAGKSLLDYEMTKIIGR